jgi:hypothetical protein
MEEDRAGKARSFCLLRLMLVSHAVTLTKGELPKSL